MISLKKLSLILTVMGACTCDSLRALTAEGVAPAIAMNLDQLISDLGKQSLEGYIDLPGLGGKHEHDPKCTVKCSDAKDLGEDSG